MIKFLNLVLSSFVKLVKIEKYSGGNISLLVIGCPASAKAAFLRSSSSNSNYSNKDE